MAAFHCAILGWFTRIDQVMDDSIFGTKNIQAMQLLYRPIASFVCANRPIGEDRVVVGFDGTDLMRKNPHYFFQESNRVEARLVVEDGQVAPFGSTVDGGVLVMLFAALLCLERISRLFPPVLPVGVRL